MDDTDSKRKIVKSAVEYGYKIDAIFKVISLFF